MKLPRLVLLTFFLVFLILSVLLLLKEPPVWPDEAIYADIAQNILKENRLGTFLWQRLIPNVENCACWNPPVLFYAIAFWFKLFGFSIVNQRLLSILAGLLFLVVFYLFAKLFFTSKSIWFPTLTLGSLILDFTFLKATRVSRPEIFILLFGTSSLYFLLQGFKIDNLKLKLLFIVTSGILASFTFLIHYLGIFFFLSVILVILLANKLLILRTKIFYLFMASFFTPIAIWVLSRFSEINTIKEQFFLASLRKNMESPWLIILWQTQPLSLKLLYLSYLLITAVFLVFSFISKEKKYLILSLVLLSSWVFALLGKMFWYFVLPLPFIYLAFFLLLSEIWKDKLKLKILGGIFLIIVLTNLHLEYLTFLQEGGENYSYDKFAKEILKVIPDKSTVFLSAIPDPYFSFKNQRNNKLYEFPVLATSPENYLRVLNDSDFIVYNGSYEEILFGDFLLRYIERNKLNIDKIGEPFQYQAFIIKLKPKTQRVNP